MKARILGELAGIMLAIGVLAAGYVVNRNGYKSGVNEALTAWALLDLEQSLQGTNRTNGEMLDIVCQRLGVKITTKTQTGGSK